MGSFQGREFEMTSDESRLFNLLTDYCRVRYGWFLTEMFLDKSEADYVLCFRPVNEDKGSARHACRYTRVPLRDFGNFCAEQVLTSRIKERIDQAFGSSAGNEIQ